MSATTSYDQKFYEQLDFTERSARHIAAMVFELVQPQRVIDFGCGTGVWLSVFQRLGTWRVMGVDGDFVDTQWLKVPREDFCRHDLTQPFEVDEHYDLALCLEVAEHLPPESAPGLVQSLVSAADVVMFSAAIPYQGGTHHLNEQWQSYWASLFREHDYLPIDYIRPRVWDDDGIEYYYRQNLLLYAHSAVIDANPALQAARTATNDAQLDIIHPETLEQIRVGRVKHLVNRAVRNSVTSKLKLRRPS